MKRLVSQTTFTRCSRPWPHAGYTMMEILVATALMLTIMLAVAWVFGMVGETISDSRSTLEMTGQLRNVAMRIGKELDGITVTVLPPRDPAKDEGYIEITEGVLGPVIPRQIYNPGTSLYQSYGIARDVDRLRYPPPVAGDPDQSPYEVDGTVGDFDDMVMFTTKSSGEPFVGRMVIRVDPATTGLPVIGQDDWNNDGTPDDYAYVPGVIQSDVAEVMYFVRDGTLYRRVLLVLPDFPQIDLDQRNPGFQTLAQMSYARWGFYNNDVSIRQEPLCTSSAPPMWTSVLAANTLGDLTKRENRFAHRPSVPRTLPSGTQLAGSAAGFPYHPHWWYFRPSAPAPWQPLPTHWGTFVESTSPIVIHTGLGLPTLQECSHPGWEAAGQLPNPVVNATLAPPQQLHLTPWRPYDAWSNEPHPYGELSPIDGVDPITGSMNAFASYPFPRIGEDVVLTNVVGFDVKVWDPQAWVLPATDAAGTQANLTMNNYWTVGTFTDDGVIPGVAVLPGDPGYELALAHALVANDIGGTNWFLPVGYGAYVDLNYMASMNLGGRPSGGTVAGLKLWLLNLTPFAGPGNPRSQMQRVYDTWSTHYESNWIDLNLNGVKDFVAPLADLGNEDYDFDSSSNPIIDEGTDGIDTDGNGLVDDEVEQEAPAPYPVPLRGIQIKIRVFDPDSRQVRERTVISDFLPK